MSLIFPSSYVKREKCTCLCVFHHASQLLSLIISHCQWQTLEMRILLYYMSALSCDWLLEWARWGDLAHMGLPAVSLKEKVLFLNIRNHVLTSMFGQDGLILATIVFCVGVCISTLSRCIKKELGQYPAIFTPYAWSINYWHASDYTISHSFKMVVCILKSNRGNSL